MERTRRLRWLAPFLPQGCFASGSRKKRFFARTHSTYEGEIATLRMEGLPGNISQPRGLTAEQLGKLSAHTAGISETIFCKQRDTLSDLLCWDIRWQLAESLLQKADKMSMAASIELRTPLLDIEVAKIAARIPSSLKLPQGGPGNFVLRNTLAKRLREDLARPKKGFPVPLNAWLAGPLREQVEAELFSTSSTVCSLLDRTLLRAAWNDLLAGRWDGGRVIFSLWLYETWRSNLPK